MTPLLCEIQNNYLSWMHEQSIPYMFFQIKYKLYCSDINGEKKMINTLKFVFSHVTVFKILAKNLQFFNETLKIYKISCMCLQFSKATLFVVLCYSISYMTKKVCVYSYPYRFSIATILCFTRILRFILINIIYKRLEKNMYSTFRSPISIKYLNVYVKQVQFR